MKDFTVELSNGSILWYDADSNILQAVLGLPKNQSIRPRQLLDSCLEKLESEYNIGLRRGGAVMIDLIAHKTPGPTADPLLPYTGVIELHCRAE